MKIGILALQGAFLEHSKILNELNIENFEIRQKKDIENIEFDGLILPGGESSVIGQLLKELDLFNILKEKIENGLPVFGTCAGMILLSKEIENDDRRHFSTMNIKVKRNAYGRQLGSFKIYNKFCDKDEVEMIFIRAPYVSEVYDGVKILAKYDEKIIAVRENNMLATAFHPELSNDKTIHKYFIEMIKENNGN